MNWSQSEQNWTNPNYTLKTCYSGGLYTIHQIDMNRFNDKLRGIMDQIKSENTLCYIFGDYDINVLSCENNDPTGQFLGVITSMAFFITRPTTVTATSATLIWNIFTHNILDVSTSLQFLFVTDPSDHYPIFHINRQVKVQVTQMFVYKAIFSPSNRYLLSCSLSETDLSVWKLQDTQKAFDQFDYHFIA